VAKLTRPLGCLWLVARDAVDAASIYPGFGGVVKAMREEEELLPAPSKRKA
jgi:hypothetical protein